MFRVSPDSATASIPVLTEATLIFLALKREVPNLTASEEFHPGTQLMTSLIKFLILSRSILITFSLSFFFFLVPSPTEQTLAPQAARAESVLSSLTSGTWQPRTDVQISVVFSVAPLTALSKPEGLFVLSCGLSRNKSLVDGQTA